MAPGEDNLRISDQLLNNAKEQEAKSSMDYQLLYGVVGYTEDQFDAEQRQKLRLLRLSARPYEWQGLAETIRLTKKMSSHASKQLLTLRNILASKEDTKRLDKARFHVGLD